MKHGSLKVRCSCKHDFQDSVHGKGIRVATPSNNSRKLGGSKLQTVNCTVCSARHTEFTEKS